eukprot:1158456-Pelagomonas_calceolata.AAC.1
MKGLNASLHAITNNILEAGCLPHSVSRARKNSHLSAGPSPRSAAHLSSSCLYANRAVWSWLPRCQHNQHGTTATKSLVAEDQSPSLAQLPGAVTGQAMYLFSSSSKAALKVYYEFSWHLAGMVQGTDHFHGFSIALKICGAFCAADQDRKKSSPISTGAVSHTLWVHD